MQEKLKLGRNDLRGSISLDGFNTESTELFLFCKMVLFYASDIEWLQGFAVILEKNVSD